MRRVMKMKKADFIFKSNAIFDGHASLPKPGYVIVTGNTISYQGNDEKLINEYMGETTRIIDAKDCLVMPGFHDAHLHFYMSGLYGSDLVMASFNDTSEEECVNSLKDFARLVPKDRWLIGAGWYHPLWDNPVLPTKESLDAVYPDRPVCMVSGDAHTMWFNSVGLEKIGITKDTPDPTGDSYGRLENGELSGIIHEKAAMELFTEIFSFTHEEENRFYKKFIDELNSYGITSICDMAMTAVSGADFIKEDIYQRLLDDGQLTVRVNIYPTLDMDLGRAKKLMKSMSGDILRCQGVKQFADGVSGNHTAYLKEDYTNAEYPGDRGTMTIPFDEMRRMILNAHKNDISVRIHTVGDQAIHELLDIFEEANQKYGYKDYLQHTLEHLENFQPDDIARMARLHVLPSVQPEHVLIDPVGVERDLGQERIRHMWPFRRLLDTGSVLAFGTDSPDADINPFWGLYNAVTRQSVDTMEPKGGWMPEEKISLEEAFSAYTYGSAHASLRSNKLGLLEEGMLADIVVLDCNPFAESSEKLLDTNVTLTMMDGKIVYEKTQGEEL